VKPLQQPQSMMEMESNAEIATIIAFAPQTCKNPNFGEKKYSATSGQLVKAAINCGQYCKNG